MASDRGGASDGVPFGIALVFGLDKEIRFAGGKNVGLNQLAKFGRHLLRLIEPVYFALFGGFDESGDDDARIENVDMRLFGDGAKFAEGFGVHAALDQGAVDQNAERKMLRDIRFPGQRRRVGEFRRDDGAVVQIGGVTTGRLLVTILGVRAHVSRN